MSEQKPTGTSTGFDPSGNRGFGVVCRVRPPLPIDFEAFTGKSFDGKTQLAQEGEDLALRGGTLALNYIAITITNGGDYTSVTRQVLVAFCNNSFDVDGHDPFPRAMQILFNDTVASDFVRFDNLPVPRDTGGPLLKALRIRVGPGLGKGRIEIGLVELYGVGR